MTALYQRLSQRLDAIARCEKELAHCTVDDAHCPHCVKKQEWVDIHQEHIDMLCERLPSGSGFDSGTTLEQLDNGHGVSTSKKLVFHTSYHHMNENGYYDGWTEHNVIITPSLQFGFNMRITGKDRNGIKEYIAEVFDEILTKEAL